MSKIQLGEVPDDKSRRDAVHVAIFPCQISGDKALYPGEPVMISGNQATDCRMSTADGIIDPFLPWDEPVDSLGRLRTETLPDS